MLHDRDIWKLKVKVLNITDSTFSFCSKYPDRVKMIHKMELINNISHWIWRLKRNTLIIFSSNHQSIQQVSFNMTRCFDTIFAFPLVCLQSRKMSYLSISSFLMTKYILLHNISLYLHIFCNLPFLLLQSCFRFLEQYHNVNIKIKTTTTSAIVPSTIDMT